MVVGRTVVILGAWLGRRTTRGVWRLVQRAKRCAPELPHHECVPCDVVRSHPLQVVVVSHAVQLPDLLFPFTLRHHHQQLSQILAGPGWDFKPTCGLRRLLRLARRTSRSWRHALNPCDTPHWLSSLAYGTRRGRISVGGSTVRGGRFERRLGVVKFVL